METINQNCSVSTLAEKQCEGLSGKALTTAIAPERFSSCRTDREADCPCARIDRLEADLGIMGGAADQKLSLQAAKSITPEAAAAMIEADAEKGTLAILDVSTGREYRKWHLRKAFNIDIFSMKFSEKLNKLDKERTYLVYCKMGARSAAAQKVMVKRGFREVFNIVGGRDRWRLEGLPHGAGPAGTDKVRNCPIVKCREKNFEV